MSFNGIAGNAFALFHPRVSEKNLTVMFNQEFYDDLLRRYNYPAEILAKPTAVLALGHVDFRKWDEVTRCGSCLYR